ncbi:MAG TPA: uroporphyrinogen decarboxylase family protein [Bryobacteraceae bacterium]|nr:uroporphyrinogen decarboxylase family protein [Bryobacteraceae bacterium]
MTSRERVLAAIAHREADRVPIDHGSMRSTGIMAIAYNRLKRHLGVTQGPTVLYDLIQQLAQPDQWYLDRFHVDAVDLGRAFWSPDQGQPWGLPDGSPAVAPAWFQPEQADGGLVVRDASGTVIGKMPRDSLYIDQCFWPLSGPDGLDCYEPLAEKMQQVTWAGIPASPFDQPLTGERLEEIARVARHLYETTDYAISLSVGCNLFEWSQFLFGMENLYVYIAAEKRKLGLFLDRLTELHIENLRRLLPKVRGYVQILVVGDDLGMQSGPQLSRQAYHDLFFPRHRRIYRYAREQSGAHIFLHSCGGIYQLIPELIEAGVEILNPVQTSARHMEPERLKREFGRELTFWGGGCDTQRVLATGTPAQVREDVRRRLEVFMPGGGYVWNQVHNVMADVPPENIVAMLEAAYEFGRY